jgi:hypothetical protein
VPNADKTGASSAMAVMSTIRARRSSRVLTLALFGTAGRTIPVDRFLRHPAKMIGLWMGLTRSAIFASTRDEGECWGEVACRNLITSCRYRTVSLESRIGFLQPPPHSSTAETQARSDGLRLIKAKQRFPDADSPRDPDFAALVIPPA